MKRFTLFIAGVLFSSSLCAQAPISEGIGSYVKSPEQKAMECYGRGLKAKKKAEGETDPAKQTKLYQKAVDELSKSVNTYANYDGYLALGQVYMALGNQKASIKSCSQALGLKPNSEAAKSCIQAAQGTQGVQEEAASGQEGNGDD